MIAETTTWAELHARLVVLVEHDVATRRDLLVRSHHGPDLGEEPAPNLRVLGVEVEAPFESIGCVFCSELPAGRVATTTHRGSFALAAAHDALAAACERSGLAPIGPRWEIYGHWNKPGDEEVEIYYRVQ